MEQRPWLLASADVVLDTAANDAANAAAAIERQHRMDTPVRDTGPFSALLPASHLYGFDIWDGAGVGLLACWTACWTACGGLTSSRFVCLERE